MLENNYSVQYERWMDFALRIVDKVYTVGRNKRAKIKRNVKSFIESYKDEQVLGWDESSICDTVKEYFDDIRWKRPNGEHDDLECSEIYQYITSAIRAGLDVAIKPSAGVAGFTVGDLRKMYPEGIPEWVKNFFEPPLSNNAKDAKPVWL